MISSLEPAIDPNNRQTFLLDWEITMKCNLDCSYCSTGIYGGHDNSTQHPPLEQCLSTIDFMYEYVDLYMASKPKGLKYVVLNVYGGESLHHPNVADILQQCRIRWQQRYQDRWHLTITTTTNLIISQKKLDLILPHIDEFTVSYHSETTPRQQQLFKDNILKIQQHGNRVKCVILMHGQGDLFLRSQNMVEWCQQNQVKYLPRQLDHRNSRPDLDYSPTQIIWLQNVYQTRSHKIEVNLDIDGDLTDPNQQGRACCGGRQLCRDTDYRQRQAFVQNQFPDWHCSVDEFFLFIKQVNGEIFVNKDCRMNFDGDVGPIGNLSDTMTLLDHTRSRLSAASRPVIQCQRKRCYCGLCAPKAQTRQQFDTIMEKYRA